MWIKFDNDVGIAYFPTVQSLQRYSRTFWVIAVLLLVGGQLAHAYSDCRACHSDAEHCHSDSGESQPSEPHDCCHTHPSASFVGLDSHGFVSLHLVCATLPVTNDSLPDSPVQEIDHPPQLS
jgi:hypothetical protein